MDHANCIPVICLLWDSFGQSWRYIKPAAPQLSGPAPLPSHPGQYVIYHRQFSRAILLALLRKMTLALGVCYSFCSLSAHLPPRPPRLLTSCCKAVSFCKAAELDQGTFPNLLHCEQTQLPKSIPFFSSVTLLFQVPLPYINQFLVLQQASCFWCLKNRLY